MARKIKVLMVQTANMNLGDTILADNDYYLLRKAFFPRKCDILRYSISSRDVGQVKYVDAVVFAGGIIKSTNENFWLYIPELIREAQQHGVPVFLSAIGVEKFYPADERSIALKQALNLPCVKGISVRDDIETLKRDYITNPSIQISSVYDPAIWCKYTYRKYLPASKSKSEIIGLGVVREKLFSDYGHPEIDRQFQLDFWKSVIEELEKRNLPWKIFTNGDTYDELFAKEVLEYIGHGEKLSAPRDGVQLVQNISTFRGAIAGRMHSNIVAYSLGIPSVGFIWNQKLAFWGQKIGYPERFLSTEEMTAKKAVDTLLHAIKQHSAPSREQRDTVYLAIKQFVKKWCRVREAKKETIDFQDKMIAHALGGIEIRYKNTNSLEAFRYSLAHGYQNFQLDLRLTSDNALVCVNRWHKDTFKIMNRPIKDGEKPQPLSLKEFQKSKYYNRFETMSFEQFISSASEFLKKVNEKVVLAVGCPGREDFERMIEEVKKAIERYQISPNKFMIRLEKKGDIEYFMKKDIKMDIVYHVADPKATPEKAVEACQNALEYCRSKKIKYISMNPDLYTAEIAAICSQYAVKVCVFTCTKTERIINAIQQGASLVGSHYYDVKYLKRLTR